MGKKLALHYLNILSRIRGSVTNNNGFWIGFIGTSLQLRVQSTTTVYNPRLPTTRSIPYWTTSVFSSTVADLVLIYESATSTQTDLNDDCLVNFLANESLNSLTNESFFSARLLISASGNHGKCLLPVCCHGNLLTEPLPSKGLFRVCSFLRECVWRAVG
jgi:hypothetical protein